MGTQQNNGFLREPEKVRWLDDNVQGNKVNVITPSSVPMGNYQQIESTAIQTKYKPIDNRSESVLFKPKTKKSPVKTLLGISIILNLVFVGLFAYYVNKSNSLSNEINDWEEEYNVLFDENNELNTDKNKLEMHKKQLEIDYSDLNQKYNKSQSDYNSLEENYSALQFTNVKLNEELDTLKINYSELQDELVKLKNEYDELNQTFYDLIEYYYNQTEVLRRDRKIYHEYKITCSWPGYSDQLIYTFEWTLSGYFDSLRRDHSINWADDDSVIKFANSYDNTNFKSNYLLNNYPNKADLANAILDIVHALEYRLDPPIGEDVRYPEETLIEGCGDCEDVAILTAAMMEGNGLDAILVLWPGHMNTAVYLSSPPPTYSGSAWYIEYNSKKYYFCEPTGDYGSDIGRLGEDFQNEVPDGIYEV